MWIAIVEDDPNISEIEAYAMKNSGFSVSSFQTARIFMPVLPSAAGPNYFGYHATR